MNRCFVLVLLMLMFAGCNSISLENIDKDEKVFVLPTLNFSGYDIHKFPVIVYRDAELTRLFEKIDPNTRNLADVLQSELYLKFDNADGNITKINSQSAAKHMLTGLYDKEFIASFTKEHDFTQAYFCVVTDVSLKNLFTEREFYLSLQIVSIDSTGEIEQKAGKDFVIHMPTSVFTPLGVDLSNAINEICRNIIDELT